MVDRIAQIHTIFTKLTRFYISISDQPFVHRRKRAERRDNCYFNWLVHESLLEILISFIPTISDRERQYLAKASHTLNKANCDFHNFPHGHRFTPFANPIPIRYSAAQIKRLRESTEADAHQAEDIHNKTQQMYRFYPL
jgi:hypothetical protein